MPEIGPDDWEKAFTAYGLDAASGRLFRGLTHNLNGVAQAFSMQTELLQMLFVQGDALLTQIETAASLAEAQELARKLHGILARRAALVVHLEREVGVIREIMQRCSGLVPRSASDGAASPFSLRSAVETELEFLKGDGFFKHQVHLDVDFPANLPLLFDFQVEIHQILAALLENSSQAMQANYVAGQSRPCLRVTASLVSDNRLQLSISDNGDGVTTQSLTRIFEPFFTTRPGRLGMGLWLAGRLAERIGGQIRCQSALGQTVFTLVIPGPGGHHAQ